MGMKHSCCPRCGSLKLTESLDSNGTVQYKCGKCRSRFGDENEAKEYAELLVKFLIEIKDILGNKMVIKLTKEMNNYKYYLKFGRSKGFEGDLNFEFWKDLSNKLFIDCSFHKWNETYFGAMYNYGIVWDMEASFERRHTLSVHGCNDFPVYWKKIISSIVPLLEKSEGNATFIHDLLQK